LKTRSKVRSHGISGRLFCFLPDSLRAQTTHKYFFYLTNCLPVHLLKSSNRCQPQCMSLPRVRSQLRGPSGRSCTEVVRFAPSSNSPYPPPYRRYSRKYLAISQAMNAERRCSPCGCGKRVWSKDSHCTGATFARSLSSSPQSGNRSLPLQNFDFNLRAFAQRLLRDARAGH
jgi:hypothetical protein